MKAHVFFDPEKQVLDEKVIYAHIERLEAELEKMCKSGHITKKHTDFFIVEQEKKGTFSFMPDNEKIDERLSRAGFFVLLSNDRELTSTDVLAIYKGKDVIEKNFDQLKNSLDFRRLRTHINQTTDGKVFVGFLALILRSGLLKKIKDNKETKHLTLEKVILELRKIKIITYDDSSRKLTPLTKSQKTILETAAISTKELLGSV